MTLYEMLDKGMANQKVWIFEQNVYDQNMPLFKGTVNDARVEPELIVWDFLMCEVAYYRCTYGILDIRVKDENYNKRLEEHYVFSDRWDKYNQSKRPWRYSIEIENEKQEQDGEK